MAAYNYDLGILGGGAAGLSAAAGAAQFGAKTILVEKANRLGGDCLHFGCVPSKTLIRTAEVWSLVRRAGEFGLPEMELPPVSLAAVMERVRSVIDKIQEHDSPERSMPTRRLPRSRKKQPDPTTRKNCSTIGREGSSGFSST
jgi:pyruvate/2-oxoglutarate dehydrogenase complex dihydrolipoamide dehydrogenase (E3) component